MIRLLLLGLGGIAWTGVAFLGGIYLTFPGSAARDWLQWKIADSSNDEYAIEMSPVSLWWFPGVKANDVTVYSVKKPRKSKSDPEAPMERTAIGHFDELAGRVQIIPRILGTWSYGFSAEFNGGDVDGHYANSDSVTELAFESDGIDLALSPVNNDTVSLNLVGQIDADCDLTIDKEDIKSSAGSLKIDIPGFGIADGSTVVGLALDPVSFSKATVSFEAKDGKLEVTEGVFTSDTVNATLSGDISLNKKLTRSRYRLELAFTLPESLDKMVGLVPDMKRSRDKEGNYHVMVSGNLLSPKFRAGKGTGKKLLDGGGAAGANDQGLEEDDNAGSSSSDEAREERRKRREERIKERRERMKARREEARGRGGVEDGPPGSGDEEIIREPRGGDEPPMNYDDEIPPPPSEPPDNMPDIGPPGQQEPPGQQDLEQ